MRANPRTQPWRSDRGRSFPAPFRRRWQWWRRHLRTLTIVGAAIVFGVVARLDTEEGRSGMLALLSAESLSAPRNCSEARARGLAPARRGQPGYAPWLDADNDGVACEPYRGR
jgi:hypothetical protein